MLGSYLQAFVVRGTVRDGLERGLRDRQLVRVLCMLQGRSEIQLNVSLMSSTRKIKNTTNIGK